MTEEQSTPPLEVYQIVAADQARRWEYTDTLDPEALAAYIRERAEDPNLRADVEAVWRYAVFYFFGRADGGPR